MKFLVGFFFFEIAIFVFLIYRIHNSLKSKIRFLFSPILVVILFYFLPNCNSWLTKKVISGSIHSIIGQSYQLNDPLFSYKFIHPLFGDTAFFMVYSFPKTFPETFSGDFVISLKENEIVPDFLSEFSLIKWAETPIASETQRPINSVFSCLSAHESSVRNATTTVSIIQNKMSLSMKTFLDDFSCALNQSGHVYTVFSKELERHPRVFSFLIDFNKKRVYLISQYVFEPYLL